MSTDEQAGSPERQRAQVLPYCQRKGYEVVEVYEDLGMRGSDSSRPAFQRLLRDAETGRFTLIVVDEQSRLSRDNPYEFFESVVPVLRRAGVSVECVDQGRAMTWESDDIVGFLVGALGQHKASNESVSLGRRTATGMEKRAKEGQLYVGRAPYGYRYKKHDGQRVGIEPDTDSPEKLEVVRRVFTMYAEHDQSVMSIVAELNASGVPSPNGRPGWVKTTVSNLLKNPAYAGHFCWGRVSQGKYYRYDGQTVKRVVGKPAKATRQSSENWLVVKNHHEPIVSPELFDKVQGLLASNRGRTSPSRKKATYPLSQILLCSHCGSPMYGTMRSSGGKKSPVYQCGSYMTRGCCNPYTVTEEVMRELVGGVLRDFVLHPENRDKLLAQLRQEAEQESTPDETSELRAKLKKLDALISASGAKLMLLDQEDIPAAQVQLRQWRAEKSKLQAELGRLESGTTTASAEQVVGKVERLVEVLAAGSPDLVRQVVREVIGRVELHFDAMKKAKVYRYPLAGGVIHINSGCADLGTSGRGAAH